MYKIGELSKLSKIPVKTLRFYDNEGILSPDYIDEVTGYRYYDAAKLSDCYRIIALKELGFGLREIKKLFSLPKESFRAFLEEKQEELRRLQKQTENRIAILRNMNSRLKECISMYDVVIRNSDEIRLAYDRKIISSKQKGEEILQRMRGAIPSAILGRRTVLIDYETEYVSQDLDTGLGVEITGNLPKNCPFAEKTVAFTSTTANLVCQSHDYEDAVSAIHKYVLDNDYQIVGPVYKIMYEDNTVEIKLPVVKLGDFDINYNEDIDLPFTDDPDIIGHWEMTDVLPCREIFHPHKRKSVLPKDFANADGLYFLPGGEKFWFLTWTKGLMLSECGYPARKSQNRYTIEKIEGETFLFAEFKGPDYYRGGRPDIWVLRKLDSGAYRKQDIMAKDEIPDTPADDSSVLGKWDVCDLVRPMEEFDPRNTGTVLPYDALYWRTAEFTEGGGMANSFRNRGESNVYTDGPEVWRWVTGYVICNPRSTASKYVIRILDGAEYLFVQWKSGDYSFGGDEPYWYVFKRHGADA